MHRRILAFTPPATLLNLLLLVSASTSARAADNPLEVTDNPAILVSPNVKASDLMVYGVKLGDPIEKIPDKAAVAKKPADDNLEITYCIGRDVAYVAHMGKIVQIALGGDLITKLGPYDSTRIQITLGKADQVHIETDAPHDTYVTFLTRQLRFAIRESHGIQARISVVTLYAP